MYILCTSCQWNLFKERSFKKSFLESGNIFCSGEFKNSKCRKLISTIKAEVAVWLHKNGDRFMIISCTRLEQGGE